LEKKVKDSIIATQVKNTVPSHILSAYTGTYSNTIYGSVSIEIQNGQLIFLFRKQRSILFHFHYDQYTTREENDLDNFRLNFFTNGKGEIDRISMSVENDPLTDFVKENK
jgi:argininosuccinate synthase